MAKFEFEFEMSTCLTGVFTKLVILELVVNVLLLVIFSVFGLFLVINLLCPALVDWDSEVSCPVSPDPLTTTMGVAWVLLIICGSCALSATIVITFEFFVFVVVLVVAEDDELWMCWSFTRLRAILPASVSDIVCPLSRAFWNKAISLDESFIDIPWLSSHWSASATVELELAAASAANVVSTGFEASSDQRQLDI